MPAAAATPRRCRKAAGCRSAAWAAAEWSDALTRTETLMRTWLLILGMLLANAAHAGEWPQILGPTRSGVAQDETLLAAWPAGGPRVLWKQTLGEGYSGVAVSGGKVIAFDRIENQERVQAFDAATGKPLWEAKF